MLVNALDVIHAARPGMALYPRVIIDAMLLAEHSIGSADQVADRLGLRNRFRLARLLKREGLPPLHRLAGWVTILSWVGRAEGQGESLCTIAFHSRRHPSACYRLVKEITGCRWEQLLANGSSWVQRELLRELGSHASLS